METSPLSAPVLREAAVLPGEIRDIDPETLEISLDCLSNEREEFVGNGGIPRIDRGI
jgi:hypothetical protein